MIPFKLIYTLVVGMDQSYSFLMEIQSSGMICWREYPFFTDCFCIFTENPVSLEHICLELFLDSVLLHWSLPLHLLLYCLDNYSFIIKSDSASPPIFFKFVLAILDPLHFNIDLELACQFLYNSLLGVWLWQHWIFRSIWGD